MDLGQSPSQTTHKLKPILSPPTRVKGLTDSSNWIVYKHGTEEVTVERMNKTKAYIDYIKNSEFETTKVFEWENISLTRPTEFGPLT